MRRISPLRVSKIHWRKLESPLPDLALWGPDILRTSQEWLADRQVRVFELAPDDW